MSSHILARFPRRLVLRGRDYLLLPPLMLVFSLISQHTITSWEVFTRWLIVNIASIALVGLCFLLVQWVFRATPVTTPVSALSLVAVGALLGGLKGASTAAIGFFAGLESDFEEAVLARLPQTLAIGALCVWGVTVGVVVREILAARGKDEVARAVHERFSSLSSVSDIDTPVIKRALAIARKTLAELPETSASFESVVNSVVRPLSHELWQEARASTRAMTVTWMGTRVVAGRLFSPVVVSSVWAVTSFPVHLARTSVAEAAVATVIGGLILALVLFAVKALPQRDWAAGLTIVGLALSAWSGLMWLLATMWWGSGHPMTSPLLYLSALMWVGVLVVLSGVLTIVTESGSGAAFWAENSDEVAQSAHEAYLSEQLSKFLHGEVANRLLVFSTRDSFSNLTSATDFAEAKERLLSRLDSGAWLGHVDPGHGSTESVLSSIATQWGGILEVEVDNRLPGPLAGLELSTVAEVVNEALSNCARHGLARHAQVSLSRTAEGELHIQVTDDGVGPREGTPGLGSTIFDQATNGRWSLRGQDTGGAVCTLTIPSLSR